MSRELLVDVRVVDDLADEVDPAVGELHPGLVGVVHRPVHPVAEPEFPGQAEGQRSDVEAIVVRPQRLDDRAVVVGDEPPLDLGLEAEAAPEVGAFHGLNLHPSRPARVECVGVQPRAAGTTGTSKNDPLRKSRPPSVTDRTRPSNRPQTRWESAASMMTAPLSP